MSNKTRLKELIKKVVEVAVPDKIILFGSRAKGEQTEESDYDICVIKEVFFIKEALHR